MMVVSNHCPPLTRARGGSAEELADSQPPSALWPGSAIRDTRLTVTVTGFRSNVDF